MKTNKLSRRILASLFIFAFAASMTVNSVNAQVRGIGAGALILDDYNGHTVAIQAPIFGSPEANAWSANGYAPYIWSIPIPPANNAQSGFLYNGPLTPTGSPYPAVVSLPYWLYPNQTSLSGDGHTGGVAGAWDYATVTQLGILATGAPLGDNEAVITNGSGLVVTIPNGGNNTVLHGTTPPAWSAVSLTSDVTGTLPVGSGGTGQTSLPTNDVLVGNGTSGITSLPTADNGILITSAGGVPSISSTLPSAVQSNITSVGTIGWASGKGL